MVDDFNFAVYCRLLIDAIDEVLMVVLVMFIISIADFVIVWVALLVEDEEDFAVVVGALLIVGGIMGLIVLIDLLLDGFVVLSIVEVVTLAVSKNSNSNCVKKRGQHAYSL